MVSEISHTKINSIYLCLYMDSKEQKCRYNETETDSWYRGQTSVVQWHSNVWLFVTPWTAARQASLSITDSQSLLKFMFIESVRPSNHLILCLPTLLIPSIFPIIRVFSNESVLHIRWSKYWSISFNIRPSNEYSGLIPFRIDWFDLLAVEGLSRVFSNTIFQKHWSSGAQLSLWFNSHIHIWLPEKPWLWLYGPLSAK